jgi:hypothetical protein
MASGGATIAMVQRVSKVAKADQTRTAGNSAPEIEVVDGKRKPSAVPKNYSKCGRFLVGAGARNTQDADSPKEPEIRHYGKDTDSTAFTFRCLGGYERRR